MKKVTITVILFLLIITTASTQTDTMRGKLPPLRPPKRVAEKYVNFDVLKLVKIGHGRNTYGIDNGAGLCIDVQVLYPVALMKNTFPIAWGLRFGMSKMTMVNADLQFKNNELTAIIENKDIRNTVQRTGHVGFMAMYVQQLKSEGITILAGASIDYNLFSRLRIREGNGTTKVPSGKYINSMSVPLHLQISRSKRQFLSCGLYGSYDMRPRFKGPAFKGLKQIEIGTCLALII